MNARSKAISALDVTSDPILRVENITKSFLGVNALNGATFDVPRNKITALIGPNGAGKTTVVNLLSGALKIDTGKVYLGSTDITNMERYKIAAMGLMRTFQLSRELSGLSVLENLLVAPRVQAGESLFNIFFRPGRTKREEGANIERALGILQTYGLYDLRDNRASALSGGQKKLLEIARGVMANPAILLLDEPMAGVNPALIDQIGEYILDLKKQGMTLLMIEHNLNIVEKICDHVIVLAEGRTLATGRLSDLRANAEVVKAYLGEVINASTSS